MEPSLRPPPGLTVADGCVSREREELVSSFILLTNTPANSSLPSLPPSLPSSDPRVLSVSQGGHLTEVSSSLD